MAFFGAARTKHNSLFAGGGFCLRMGTMAHVSLVGGQHRKDNIAKALQLIREEIDVRGKVLIKPNLSALANKDANTDVEAVAAIIEFFNKEYVGLQITVGDCSGGAYYAGQSTRTVLERFGYYELERYGNVKVVDFDNWSVFNEITVQMVRGTGKCRIMKHDFDYVVSVSLPKTHDFVIASLGIKNLIMGLTHKEDRIFIHGLKGRALLQRGTDILSSLPPFLVGPLDRLGEWIVINFSGYCRSVIVTNRNLAALAKVLKPDLVVLDGLYGMEGDGPIEGDRIRLDVAIASVDPLKADGVGVRLMGLEPKDIGYLYYLQEDGYGDYSLEGLAGDSIETYRRNFKMHSRYHKEMAWRE